MKIPIDIDKEFKIGDRIRLLVDYTCDYALFKVGHEFTIIGTDTYGFVLQDEDGDIIKRMMTSKSDRYTKIISYKDAEFKYKTKSLDNEISLIISCDCPYKTGEYWDRNMYEVCTKQGNIDCKGTINCLSLGDGVRSNVHERNIQKLDKYIRLRKINKLME